MSNLKDLLLRRSDCNEEVDEVNEEICRLLAEPCRDTIFLYSDENPLFNVRGMDEYNVHKRLLKVFMCKSYEGINESDFEFVKTSDVKRALNFLVSKGKIRVFWEGYSINESSMEIYLESKKN